MKVRKVALVVVVLSFGALTLLFATRKTDEVTDALHYLRVELEGKLRSKFVTVEIPEKAKAGESIRCKVVVENLGTETWERGKNYIALGLCERSEKGKRQVSAVKLLNLEHKTEVENGDRIIISLKTKIEKGKQWNVEFFLQIPTNATTGTTYKLELQMVKEDVTWFGGWRTVRVEVR